MSTNRNLLTSPVGSIMYLAGENSVEDSKTGKKYYSIKLAFDSKKDKEFLDQVSKINSAKVVTAATYRGTPKAKSYEATKAVLDQGKSMVEAKSIYKPKVYDNKGNELEESPMFFADNTGTAQMIVQPYQGEKGGTLNLVGIIIHEIKGGDSSKGTDDKEARLAQLREAVKAATK